MEWLTSFAVTETLGTIGSYLLAGAFVAGGVYIAGFAEISDKSVFYPFVRPIKYVGLGLAAFGIVLASAAYFKHVGAAQCEAAWKQKNLELQIANLRRDLTAARDAAQSKAEEAKVLADQKATADAKVSDYEASVEKMSRSLSACRRSTADDDRRLCDIVGNAAPGCQPSR